MAISKRSGSTTVGASKAGSLSLWARWTVFCGIGEFLGMAVAAGAASLAFHQVPLAALTLMVIAGAIEGIAVGVLQQHVLKRRFARISARKWIGVTAAAAAIGWLLGMMPSLFMTGSPTPEAGSFEPHPSAQVLFAALIGTALGGAFGAAQWTLLRRHATNAKLWVTANMLGWSAAMVIIFTGANLPSENAPLLHVISLGAVTGIAAGLALGAITGAFLVRLLPSEN